MNDPAKFDNPGDACGREPDLIAYLYGEADAGQAADFTSHLARCAKCADEAAAFPSVRAGISLWRDSVPRLAQSFAGMNFVPTPRADAPRPVRSWRQTRDALAELFRVTPRWLQAGAGVAALVLCALVLFSISDEGRTRPDELRTANTHNQASATSTEEEINRRVDQEVARRLDALRADESSSTIARVSEPPGVADIVPVNATQSKAKVKRRAPRRDGARARTSAPRRADEEIDTEEDLPRLSDLLYGTD